MMPMVGVLPLFLPCRVTLQCCELDGRLHSAGASLVLDIAVLCWRWLVLFLMLVSCLLGEIGAVYSYGVWSMEYSRRGSAPTEYSGHGKLTMTSPLSIEARGRYDS